MSYESRAKKDYAKKEVEEILNRLSKETQIQDLPFSEEEIITLIKKVQQSPYGGDIKEGKLEDYKTHLSKTYNQELVSKYTETLTKIYNQILWEGK